VLWVGVYVDDGRGAIEWGHCVFVSVGISELIHDEYSCMDVSLGVWDAPLTINADEPLSMYVLSTGTGGLSAVSPLHAFVTLNKRAYVEGSGYTSGGKITAARDVDVDLASESMSELL